MNYVQFLLLFFTLLRPWTPLHASQFSTPLDDDSCRGRRIFMYDLPAKFNGDILKQCKFGLMRWLNLCPRAANYGFGPQYKSSLGDGWFDTDTYMLEIIFHERIKQYRCLTPDPAVADAVFVPYYAGLDALRYLYPRSDRVRESSHGVEVMSWLKNRCEWKRRRGKDHFMVMARTAWDFRVGHNWGTGMLEVPGVSNMTLLTIERHPWRANQQAVPYPTSFHPSSEGEIQEWTNRVRASNRTRLFAFAGSVRPYADDGGFRSLLMRLCVRSPQSCRLLDCVAARCSHEAEPAMRAFMGSIFCLQPRGDTQTRRSTFDAVIAGCIPVFFHIDSAYTQYTWHLPSEEDEGNGGYSVYIPQDDVVANVSVVERVLRGFSSEQVKKMQEKVLSLIPRVIYMMKSTTGDSEAAESVRDAFDISVERVAEIISQQQQAAEYQAEKEAVGFEDEVTEYQVTEYQVGEYQTEKEAVGFEDGVAENQTEEAVGLEDEVAGYQAEKELAVGFEDVVAEYVAEKETVGFEDEVGDDIDL